MSVFEFDRAIVREPGLSVVDGIRADRDAVPDYATVLEEHRRYVAALRAAGLQVDVLPPLESYPDSMFVEDPALVLPEGAILLRPGAPARQGESAEMRVPLNRHFHRVLELRDDETVDGGDVLVTPDTIFIGLSQRTTRIGAEALSARLAEFGRAARIVETPKGILHFKTAVSLLDDNTIVATQRFAASAILPGFKLLTVPEGEDAAANLLRVNDKVLVGEAFPRTIALIEKHGFAVEALPVGEIGKLDGGLSCMSLRWRVA